MSRIHWLRPLCTSLLVFVGIFLVLFPDNSLPDRFAHFASDQFNQGFQILAHLLIFSIAWSWRSWKPVLLDMSVTFAVNSVLQITKHFLIADIAIRPSGGFGGFPSGHAAATFSLAFLLSLYYPRLWWAWYTAAALVTWSRVQTNAHTELQVAAGMLFGTVVAWGFAKAMWKEKRTMS
ncbi:MAG TPA: phosphatase PAP2 family protein [Negativicutes bacterium]|nr:phosphatase PAP2 family protein [Negativicutes bacterium]